MTGRTDGWRNGWPDEQKGPCVFQDLVGFGTATLRPLTCYHNHRVKGIFNPITPLGCCSYWVAIAVAIAIAVAVVVTVTVAPLEFCGD